MMAVLVDRVKVTHDFPTLEESMAWLLAVRPRGGARAFIDRAIVLARRALDETDLERLAAIDREVDALGDEMLLRFGAPRGVSLH